MGNRCLGFPVEGLEARAPQREDQDGIVVRVVAVLPAEHEAVLEQDKSGSVLYPARDFHLCHVLLPVLFGRVPRRAEDLESYILSTLSVMRQPDGRETTSTELMNYLISFLWLWEEITDTYWIIVTENILGGVLRLVLDVGGIVRVHEVPMVDRVRVACWGRTRKFNQTV